MSASHSGVTGPEIKEIKEEKKNDRVTIGLYSKESVSPPGYNKTILKEFENIKNIRNGLFRAATEAGKKPPEIIISLLLIPNWGPDFLPIPQDKTEIEQDKIYIEESRDGLSYLFLGLKGEKIDGVILQKELDLSHSSPLILKEIKPQLIDILNILKRKHPSLNYRKENGYADLEYREQRDRFIQNAADGICQRSCRLNFLAG